MNNLELLKIYCDAQIELMENSIKKNKLMTKRRRRWLMAQIVGIGKVKRRIEDMISQEEISNERNRRDD